MGVPAERTLICEDGDQITIDDDGIRVSAQVPAGYLYVDGIVGDVGQGVLRDRRVLAEAGVVGVVLTVAIDDGAIPTGPGLGIGIDEDARVVRQFAATPGPLFISSSFSKSFSLYGERVGACTVVTADKEEAARVLSQMKRVVRANYSNPPTHGGQIVARVLSNPELREIWEMELGGMRERIREMRGTLVRKLAERVPTHDMEFVRQQRGMFSYSGLNQAQVGRLRDEFSIYAIDTGRICVASLNSKNIEYVADAIAAVL
jgi:aromatic-amino-acid transaminase